MSRPGSVVSVSPEPCGPLSRRFSGCRAMVAARGNRRCGRSGRPPATWTWSRRSKAPSGGTRRVVTPRPFRRSAGRPESMNLLRQHGNSAPGNAWTHVFPGAVGVSGVGRGCLRRVSGEGLRTPRARATPSTVSPAASGPPTRPTPWPSPAASRGRCRQSVEAVPATEAEEQLAGGTARPPVPARPCRVRKGVPASDADLDLPTLFEESWTPSRTRLTVSGSGARRLLAPYPVHAAVTGSGADN